MVRRLKKQQTIYLSTQYTDMRKSINGLAAIVQGSFKIDPYDGALFVFSNRNHDKIKVLQWDVDGFILYYRRIERRKFQWPTRIDETVLEVLKEPGRDAETKSYMWLYRTSGCDSDRPVILFDYQPSRSADCPKAFLEGFEGYLQTDGYKAYETVAEASEGRITPLGCMAHVRRKYDEVLKSLPADIDENTSLAAKGLEYCNALFNIEKIANEKGFSAEERATHIKKYKADKIYAEFIDWAKSMDPENLPKTKLKDALTYTVNQAIPVGNYLLDSRFEISNNRAERTTKPFVIGRKNWLFSNTPKGAQASAVLYSITETAKECGLNVYRYLEYVFGVAPNIDMTDAQQIELLLPYSDAIAASCKVEASADTNN